MKITGIKTMSTTPLPLLRGALVLFFAVFLTACGGGGTVNIAAPASAVSTTSLRALPAEYLARKAVAYSPYRTATSEAGRDGETIPQANVRQDLDLLLEGNFKLIRLFDSSDKVAKLVLDVIADNNLDMKVQLGSYPNSYRYEPNPYKVIDIKAANMQELDRQIALATNPKYRDIILALSVGNETMVSWSIVPIEQAVMAGYIRYVRERTTQPVTTDDDYDFFAVPPKIITDEIDFVAMHTYANIYTKFPDGPLYWDWKQESVAAGPARAVAMMDEAIVQTRRRYQDVRDALNNRGLHALPVAITENGWNAVDLGEQGFRAHPANQKMYVSRLDALRADGRVGKGPVNIFYFEAFDEPWKSGDDGWGLFTVLRKARYVVQHLYPQSKWDSPVVTDADAVFYSPPVVGPAFAANQYTIFSEAAGAVNQTGLSLDLFEAGIVALSDVNTTSAPGDASTSIEVTPNPKNYGWGFLYQGAKAPITEVRPTENLSQFVATGRLNISIKTLYPGKIEIGLSTDTALGVTQEVFLQIGNGDYGYCNTDNWCQVSIPLQAFLAKNPKLDFSLVKVRLFVADRYSETGKPLNSGITTKLNIDGIYYSR